MRIRTAPSGLYTYADCVVGCGRLEVVDNTLTNPVLVAEVLSDSTEAYDRGRKFAWYRQIETLREYILLDLNKLLIEHFHKERQGAWRMQEYSFLQAALVIESLGVAVPVSEIYRAVDLKID